MTSQFISAEYRGLAREFRRHVDLADAEYIAAVNRITRQLQARLQRKPVLRPGTMIDIERELREINKDFRLKLDIKSPKRGHLQITDWVVGWSKDREESWEDWEKTSAIVRVHISTSTQAGVEVRTVPVATISGHAVARWYQRSGSRDQAKLLGDLTYIIDAREPDHVATPSGVWLGNIVHAHTTMGNEQRRMLIRVVRTYLNADMLERPFTRSEEAVA